MDGVHGLLRSLLPLPRRTEYDLCGGEEMQRRTSIVLRDLAVRRAKMEEDGLHPLL